MRNKGYISLLCGLFATIFVFLYLTFPVSATRGCCSHHGGVAYCDGSVGRQVCGDGTYSPTCGCAIDPSQNTPIFVPTDTPVPTPTSFVLVIKAANPTFKLNSLGTGYTVFLDWDDVPDSSGYSVGISKVAGYDPGPAVDTRASKWSFSNVKAGTWYMNVKAKRYSAWSTVVYWKVVLPKITITQKPVVKGANTTIAKPTTVKFVNPTHTPVPFVPKNTSAPIQQPGFVCNCAKTCTQITSCAEAYYQLNNCGCTVRDGDHDGVPCESLCR